jgi:diaminopimelate epimerase
MLDFHKYHGLGNDFIIVRGDGQALQEQEIAALCARHRGVGADGVLLIRPGDGGQSPPEVEMVIYNRDGSRPEMCGNGVRCVAAFAYHHWQMGQELVVLSDAGPRRCRVDQSGDHLWNVAVDMGRADVSPDPSTFEVGGQSYEYVAVDVGNPHAVVFAEAPREVIRKIGEAANDGHRAFPNGVNVEFVVPRQDSGAYEVVVYERGVGFTRACGTGACAVAAAIWETEREEPHLALTIHLPGGPLEIRMDHQSLWMTGEAVEVFRGTWSGSTKSGI